MNHKSSAQCPAELAVILVYSKHQELYHSSEMFVRDLVRVLTCVDVKHLHTVNNTGKE